MSAPLTPSGIIADRDAWRAQQVTVTQLIDALQEQVDECFDLRCEMCSRHEALIARAKATSDA